MSKLFGNYNRKDFEIVSGKGSYLVDNNGKKYLDFTSGIGVANLGYGNRKLEAALNQQNEILWHMPNLYQSQLQEDVAEKLIGDKDYLAFFCNSGAEANEAAIKLARKATGRSKIITFLDSFHGRTYGGMSATGQASVQAGFAPLVPDFIHLPYNKLEPLQEMLDQNTAAVMLELIQGEGGVLPAEKAWIQSIKQLCEANGTLLIVDEVQTGMGRTGSLYAFEQYDFEPDIFTLAKGLGNGIPVGAMLGKAKLSDAFGPGSHGSTFGGNKLAMSAAQVVLATMLETDFFQGVKTRATFLTQQLEAINSDKIQCIQGSGLMLGLVLKAQYPVSEILAALEEKGLLALRAGTNVLRLLPPLTISEVEMLEGVSLIKSVL